MVVLTFRMIVNKHYSGSSYRKPEPTASWESLYVGLKQEGEFISGILIFI
jgi:DNA mismatch repair protein MutL